MYTLSGGVDDEVAQVVVVFEEASVIEEKVDRTSTPPLRMENVKIITTRNTIVIIVVHIVLIGTKHSELSWELDWISPLLNLSGLGSSS